MVFKKSGRYSVPSDEDYEPGSNDEVLKNFLNIHSKEIMSEIEQRELGRTELELFQIYDADHQFTVEDICNIHELWLGDIYPMAGKYRTVNMDKDGFPFAASAQIEKLMIQFERNYLQQYTPCHFNDLDQLANALGTVHVELIIIHPFREGNGRTARLLADLMAVQANKPPLNYALIDQVENKQGFAEYIMAIHAGVRRDYSLIRNIFVTLLQQSV